MSGILPKPEDAPRMSRWASASGTAGPHPGRFPGWGGAGRGRGGQSCLRTRKPVSQHKKREQKGCRGVKSQPNGRDQNKGGRPTSSQGVRTCGLCLDCWGLMTDRTRSLTGEWPGGWGTQRLGKMKG